MTRFVMCFLAFSIASAAPAFSSDFTFSQNLITIEGLEFTTSGASKRSKDICRLLDGQPATGPTDKLDKKCKPIATTVGCECEEDDDGKLTNCKPEGTNASSSSIDFTCTCKSDGTTCV
ncbi:MAG: hypothetical protein ACN2B6_01715 [Rickettsiales bacterium]